MDISTTIAGVRFPSCFMNASGALCVTREELLALGRSRTDTMDFPAGQSTQWACRIWVIRRTPRSFLN
jgi:hypothetical protein